MGAGRTRGQALVRDNSTWDYWGWGRRVSTITGYLGRHEIHRALEEQEEPGGEMGEDWHEARGDGSGRFGFVEAGQKRGVGGGEATSK